MKIATTLKEIEQHINENPFALLLIKAPNCGTYFLSTKKVERFARFVPLQELKVRLDFWQNFHA